VRRLIITYLYSAFRSEDTEVLEVDRTEIMSMIRVKVRKKSSELRELLRSEPGSLVIWNGRFRRFVDVERIDDADLVLQ